MKIRILFYLKIWVEKIPYNCRNRAAMVMQDILQGVKPFEQPTEPRPTVSGLDGSLWELFDRCWNYWPPARPSTAEVAFTIRHSGRPGVISTM